MPPRPASITQAELTRYAKGLAAANVSQFRVVVRPDGSHEIIVGTGSDVGQNPLVDELNRVTGVR